MFSSGLRDHISVYHSGHRASLELVVRLKCPALSDPLWRVMAKLDHGDHPARCMTVWFVLWKSQVALYPACVLTQPFSVTKCSIEAG
jgi:hypothetical protein